MPPQASSTSTTRPARVTPSRRSVAVSLLALDATLPPLTNEPTPAWAHLLLILCGAGGIALADRLEDPGSVG